MRKRSHWILAVLLAGLVFVWVRSYVRGDHFVLPGGRLQVALVKGNLSLGSAPPHRAGGWTSEPASATSVVPREQLPREEWAQNQFLGFAFLSTWFLVQVPLWFLLLLALLLIKILQDVRRRALRGPGPGRCRSCRRDLQGVLDGACPHCGVDLAPGGVVQPAVVRWKRARRVSTRRLQ